MSSWLSSISVAPVDAVFGVADAYAKDPFPEKINLGVGAYRDEQGAPFVLSCVARAEAGLSREHEYLPQTGVPALRALAPALLFGAHSPLLPRVACIQTLSGTGALRVVGEFLKEFHPPASVYITDPTWANHAAIFQKCGFTVATLRYFDPSTRGLAFDAFLQDLERAPERSILVLHTCAHNPTGVDPTMQQWEQIEKVIARRMHTVIFDTAYQGYASGDLDQDAASLRLFAARGHNVMVCQSFAKNLGLYGERVGTLSILCPDEASVPAVISRLEKVVRPQV
jgi:aspartate/tyrosine/aromatic aminotransferase